MTSYTYYATGDVETVTDNRGIVTRFSDYKRGVAQKVVTAEGRPEEVVLKREVNDQGCITSETDGEGNKIVYGRDALCRVTAITPPKSGSIATTVVYKLATATEPETHTTTRGNSTIIEKFDGLGRLIEKSVGDIKWVWKYDAVGRKIFESYPVDSVAAASIGSQFDYDELDRPVKIVQADNKTRTLKYQVDSSGRPQTEITDERGNAITQTFRTFGSPSAAELMSIKTPVSASDVTLTRNIRGQVETVVQGGFTRTYGYDSRFFLTSTVNPETGTTTYGRDGVGNLISVKVGNSGATYYDVDGLNRVYAIRYPDSSKNVSQSWFKTGNLKSASNGVSALNWTYDANNNLESESLVVGGHEFVTSYSHDGNDRLSAISYPKKGSTLDLAPDILGRPTKVGAYVSAISYHPSGQVASMTYANGVKTTMEPDSRQRPHTLSVGKGGGSAYVGMTIDYDGVGNVSAVSDSANPSNNRSYGYDGIDRLTKVTSAGKDYPVDYDGSGNIKRQTFGGELNYTYDSSTNRLNSTSGIKAGSYSYDSRGNTTSNGSVSFQYDDNSRLLCAKCGAVDQITYDNDALGMRLSRTQGGQTTYQVYRSNGDLLMEFNSATNQRHEHIYLNGQKIATSTQAAYFATGVSLSVSAATIKPGQTVTLTAAVNGGRSPEGVVNFYDNGVFIGSGSLVNGKAVLTTSALPYGYHNFTSTYVSSDGANASSSTAVSSRVESGQVTATIMSIINSLLLDD